MTQWTNGDYATPSNLNTRRPTWSTTYPYIDVKQYGATGDGTTDDTAAIQAALDAARTGLAGAIFLPVGNYVATQLRGYPGVSIFGAGMGSTGHPGTIITQPTGQNKSLIINDPTVIPATEYWHWSRIADLQLVKATSTDTVGSGIDLTCRSGEGFKIEHVQVTGFPVNGINFSRGGAPLYLEDLHLFGNGSYGLKLARTGSDLWETIMVLLTSGDNNGTALIGIDTMGDEREQITLQGIKSETTTTGKQGYVVEIANANGQVVHVKDVSAHATVSVTGVIRITGSNCRVLWENVQAAGFTNLISDAVNTATLAFSTNWPIGAWYQGVAKFLLATGGGSIIRDGLDLATGVLKTAGTQIVTTRRTGWGTATGTATRTTFDTATVTTAQLAERVKALIDDLHGTAGHGLIGT